MKYFKKKNKIAFQPILLLLIALLMFGFLFKDVVFRSLITVNLGGFYVGLLNKKAELINAINNNDIDVFEVSMSPNNFVKLQKERTIMSSNYILTGDQWNSTNNYFKSKVRVGDMNSKAEIKLFGMNPDHYRSPNGFSFRLKFDGGIGFGGKKVNFLNPRSRDFNSDFLSNVIFSELADGIKINYDLYKVIFNKSDYGYYLKEDFFDKYLIEENSRRESLIFEVIGDSIHFNHIGDDNEFFSLSNEIIDLKNNNYVEFLERFDIDKIKTILLISLILNDRHPLYDINLHWVHNPVTGLFEPTFREGFIYELTELDFDNLNLPSLLNDIYTKHFKEDFVAYVKANLPLVKEIILNNKNYLAFKKKMIGFQIEILSREDILFKNISFIEKTINKKKSYTKQFDYRLINISNDTIITDNWKIKSDEKLIINKGVKVTLKDVYLRIEGGIEILGKENYPVNIVSPENGSSTIYIQSKIPVNISHTTFSNLTNLKSPYQQPASITFYETPEINITNSNFNKNIYGDDFLNFFRCKNVNISNTNIENTYSDALDSDFSNILINNSNFNNIGNDAIDGSGSKITISKSNFTYAKDKAISAGENSRFEVKDCFIKNNAIGVVSKDNSVVLSKNNQLINNRLDLAVFKKKKIYSYPTFKNENTLINNYLIEKKSKISGLDDIVFSSNVEDKLYGNLYGRASER